MFFLSWHGWRSDIKGAPTCVVFARVRLPVTSQLSHMPLWRGCLADTNAYVRHCADAVTAMLNGCTKAYYTRRSPLSMVLRLFKLFTTTLFSTSWSNICLLLYLYFAVWALKTKCIFSSTDLRNWCRKTFQLLGNCCTSCAWHADMIYAYVLINVCLL